MEKIIVLDDLVLRDSKEHVRAWLIWMCEIAIKASKFPRGWDGKSVKGEAVLAFVDNGRWLGRCKVCNNPMYVSWKAPIFYCVECGNGGNKHAWPVEFPIGRERIEAALMMRPVELANPKMLIRNDVEFALNARPSIPGLPRAWRPGVAAEQLEVENVERLAKKRGRR